MSSRQRNRVGGLRAHGLSVGQSTTTTGTSTVIDIPRPTARGEADEIAYTLRALQKLYNPQSPTRLRRHFARHEISSGVINQDGIIRVLSEHGVVRDDERDAAAKCLAAATGSGTGPVAVESLVRLVCERPATADSSYPSPLSTSTGTLRNGRDNLNYSRFRSRSAAAASRVQSQLSTTHGNLWVDGGYDETLALGATGSRTSESRFTTTQSLSQRGERNVDQAAAAEKREVRHNSIRKAHREWESAVDRRLAMEAEARTVLTARRVASIQLQRQVGAVHMNMNISGSACYRVRCRHSGIFFPIVSRLLLLLCLRERINASASMRSYQFAACAFQYR